MFTFVKMPKNIIANICYLKNNPYIYSISEIAPRKE